MSMIYFDIDGVIRNLHSVFKKDFKKWEDFTEIHYGQIERDPQRFFQDAPHFEEMRKLISNIDVKVFLTSSPEKYEIYTRKFILNLFKDAKVIFSGDQTSKLSYLGPDDFLVDDYPYYNDPRVILVEREYNKDYRENFSVVWRIN